MEFRIVLLIFSPQSVEFECSADTGKERDELPMRYVANVTYLRSGKFCKDRCANEREIGMTVVHVTQSEITVCTLGRETSAYSKTYSRECP